MKGKKILITGGAGFIGSNLALKLVEKGYAVTVLDNLSPQVHGENAETTSPLFLSIKDKVHFIKGDVTNKQDWEKAIAGNNVIVHFAAETGTGQSMYRINHYAQVNVGGTALMLDLLTNTKTEVEKVVIASSRSIYGEGKYFTGDNVPVYPPARSVEDMSNGFFEVRYPGAEDLTLAATDETSLIQPSSIYGITKYNQEQMVLVTCAAIGIGAVAFRYQNVYGPGQSLSNPYTGILSIFSTQLKNGQGLNIFEDGKESRDFVFIRDVVDATIKGIENDAANGEVFNVGSGVPVTVMEVAEQLAENYGITPDINITGNYRLGDIRHNYADLRKIKDKLGFEPAVFFKEGIRHFTNWVNGQELQKSAYEDSLNEMKEKGLLK